MNKPQPIGRASQTAQPSGPAPRKLRAGRPIGLKGEDVPPFSGNAAPAPKIEGQPSKPALAKPSAVLPLPLPPESYRREARAGGPAKSA